MLKKILSLALVFVMIATLGVSALAYNASDLTLPPADTYGITHYTHNVVRGETLQGIAAKYGSSIEALYYENAGYFGDLAKKNATWGLNVTLEPGKVLNIYTTKWVKHYVVNGDTLAALAATYGTNEAAIKAENAAWFGRLAELNKTQGTAFTLVESDEIDGLVASSTYGTPLKISILVHATAGLRDEKGGLLTDAHPVSTGGSSYTKAIQKGSPITFAENTLNYQGANTESANSGNQLTYDPWYISEDARPFAWRDPATPTTDTAGANKSFVTTKYKYPIPGLYGATSVSSAAIQTWYTVKAGDKLDVIAKNFGTTVAKIREVNATYFADLATRNVKLHGSSTAVAVEAGEILAIPAK
ncbi:MAG: LysM peptidoglycan-binding domain-containing protein [Oscillospiraceae bacterium]|nr:LysM peptidoglycan-binding domain-containing protein [Oscillospiraceae bacterium]